MVNDNTYSIEAEILETITLSNCDISSIHIETQSPIKYSYSYDGSNAHVQYEPNTINTVINDNNSDYPESEAAQQDTEDNYAIDALYDNYLLG